MRRRARVSKWVVLSAAATVLTAGTIIWDSSAMASCGNCDGSGRGETTSASNGCGEGAGSGCCGKGRGDGQRAGVNNQGRRGAGMSDHENIHALLDRHEVIERSVEEIDGGVVTVTTSDDPEVVRTLREHVREMQQRMESGHGMRWWDPVFAELFRNHDKVLMEIEDVPGGVRVRETSDDPDIAMLIRQHAIRGINEFVAEGPTRARQATPLPDGYGSTKEPDVRPEGTDRP